MNYNPDKYEEIEVFEENANQKVILAVEKTQYQDVVIINQIKRHGLVNDDFLRQFREIAENIVSFEETDESIIIVSNYQETQLLADYLLESPLDLKERVRLTKGFLSQISNYEQLPKAMQFLLIHIDQLTIKNNLLIFSDYLLIEQYDPKVSAQDIFVSIGGILRTILQLHRETMTPEISALKQWISELEEGMYETPDYNHLYNHFKVLASHLDNMSEVLHYCDIPPAVDVPQQRINLEYIKQKRATKQMNEEPVINYVPDAVEAPQEKTNETDIELEAFEPADHEVTFDTLDINPNFAEAFSIDYEDDIILTEDTPPSTKAQDKDKTEDIKEDLNITDGILQGLSEILATDVKNDSPIADDKDPILDKMLSEEMLVRWMDQDEDITSKKIPVEENDTVETVKIPKPQREPIQDESPVSIRPFTSELPELHEDSVAVIQTEKENNPETSFNKNRILDQEIFKSETKLNREDMTIQNQERKSYYMPSFIAFFIFLLVITTLLLYYTSTYI